jgi:hypothetical protein
MPKAGTVADREPADVKRVAAAEGVPADKTTTPVELAPTAGPKNLDRMPFFQMLSSMTEREWEDRMVYLYRQDKTIIKEDPKDSNYIARITHAFDEAYVKEKFGGGKFLAILKNVRINGAERKHSFLIEGEAKIQEGEISIAKKNEPAGGKSDNALLLEQLERVTQKLLDSASKSNGSEQDTISRSIAMLSEASRGALQIQQEAIKSQVGSPTGNAMVDKFLEKAIAKLGDEPKGGDQMEQFTRMLALVRELNRGNDKPAGGGLLGNLGEIKGVLEVLKDLGVKIGGGGAEAAAEGGMDWKSVLAGTLPQALQVVGGYVDRWIQTQQEQNRILAVHTENARRAAAGQPQLPAAPPQQVHTSAIPTAPAPIAPGPQASALPPNFASASTIPAGTSTAAWPINPPAQTGEVLPFPGASAQPAQQVEVDLDFVCTLIRRCFDAGDPGDIPACAIKRIYGVSLDPLRAYFSDGEQLKQLAGMAPIIAEIIPDDAFPDFLAEFVAEMNRDENAPAPEDEDDPDPAEGGGKSA